MKIVFLGTPTFVQPIKEELARHFTLVDSLKEADLAVVAAYGKILSEQELNTPKYGCINIHPSLLPKYRGASPIQEAILNGDKISGITIIKMDEEIDHGPIIYQEQMELSGSDNFATLSKKMFLRATEVLPEIIEDFVQGKIKLIEQDSKGATYCDRFTRASGYFDISSPPASEKLDKMIRAYYPWPGVWTKWRGKIVKLLPPVILNPKGEGSSTLINHQTTEDSPQGHFPLRGGAPLITQNDKFLIQMEGKKVMSLQDFLNGYPDFPLKQL